MARIPRGRASPWGSGPLFLVEGGRGGWRPSAEPDAGASAAALPRWSVGTSKNDHVVDRQLPCNRGHGPLLPRHPAAAAGAGRARDTTPKKKEKGRPGTPLSPTTPTPESVKIHQ